MSIWLGNQRLDGSAKDMLSYDNISNCITEIPQDIKLELSSDGTLTLKAGSKGYIPNGPGKFGVIKTTVDRTATYNNNGARVCFITQSGYLYVADTVSNMSSGATDPLAGTPWHIWYDTTNNTITRYGSDGAVVATNLAFPIAIITVSNGAISSIDEVFNGFGYIGSTIFALPGVKGLIPDGRNEDGSLKNIELTVTQVITDTRTVNGGNFVINITGPLSFDNGYINFISSESFPTSGYWICYKPSENKLYNIASGVNMGQKKWLVCGNIERGTSSPFKVLSIKAKTAFQALDYNDREYIGHQPMPSNRYIDLTLPASNIQAPADGYVVLKGQTTTTNKAYGITNESNGMRTQIRVENSGNDFGIYLPISKGQVYSVKTEGTLASGYIYRFIYANSSK